MNRADLYRNVLRNPDAGWPQDLVDEAFQHEHDARRAVLYTERPSADRIIEAARSAPPPVAPRCVSSLGAGSTQADARLALTTPARQLSRPIIRPLDRAPAESRIGQGMGFLIGLVILATLAWAWGV